MAYGDNQTRLILTVVPFSSDYEDTRIFKNVEEQIAYFGNLKPQINLTSDNNFYRFIDGKGNSSQKTIRVELTSEVAQTYNYCMYNNYDSSAGSKWTFAFIKNVNFVNYETCELEIEIDVLQTFMFDYDINEGTIERESTSVDDDSVCRISDYMPTDKTEFRTRQFVITSQGENYLFYIQATAFYDTSEGNLHKCGLTFNNSTLEYGFMIATKEKFDEYISLVTSNQDYNAESIISVGAIPKSLVRDDWDLNKKNNHIGQALLCTRMRLIGNTWVHNGDEVVSLGVLKSFFQIFDTFKFNFIIPRPSTLKDKNGGFATLYNHKCICYPYVRPIFDDDDHNLEFEESTYDNKNLYFIIYPDLTNGIEFKCLLTHYSGTDSYLIDEKYSIPITYQMPITTNSIHDFMNSNGQQLAIQSIANLMSSYATGGYVGLAVQGAGMALGVDSVSQTMKQVDRQKKITTRGNYSSDFFRCANTLPPTISVIQVDPTYVYDIDHYFTKYGYKVDRVGTPRLFSRHHFNFIKMNGCQIRPKANKTFMNDEMQKKIESIYDNGIRFWHTNNIGDYIAIGWNNYIETEN